MVRSALKPLVLAGPTASGKSALALCVAVRVGGEIVCGDSRQVYAGMRIGSASPTDEERARVPHHGYNAIPPGEPYDAGRFLEDTDRLVAEVTARGRLPILVGGAGLYLRAWRYGLSDVPPKDPEIRARLEAEIAREGTEALHARLAEVDPESARAITPKDPVRIVRALEVYALTGRRPSELRRTHLGDDVRVQAIWVLLDAPGEELNPRIEARARAMFEEGLVEEAQALADRLGAGHRLLETMGYAEALALSRGEIDLDEAVRRTARRQKDYARRQRTWFRKEPWWVRLDARSPSLFEEVLARIGGGG